MGNICDSRECGGSGPSRHVQSLYDDWCNLPHNRAARQALNSQLADGHAPTAAQLPLAGSSFLVEREQALAALDALYRMQFEERVGRHGTPNISACNGVVRLDKFHYHFEINCNHPDVGQVLGMRWCVLKSDVGFWDFVAPPPAACTRGLDSMLGTTAHVSAHDAAAAAAAAACAADAASGAPKASSPLAASTIPPQSPNMLGVVISDSTALPPVALAAAEQEAAKAAAAEREAAKEAAAKEAAAAAAKAEADAKAAAAAAAAAAAEMSASNHRA